MNKNYFIKIAASIFILCLVSKSYSQVPTVNIANTYVKVNENFNDFLKRLDTTFYKVDTLNYKKNQGVITITEIETNKLIGSVTFEDNKIIAINKDWGYEIGENAVRIFNDLFNILNDKTNNAKVKIELSSEFEPGMTTKTITIIINQFEKLFIYIYDKNIQVTQYFSDGKTHYER